MSELNRRPHLNHASIVSGCGIGLGGAGSSTRGAARQPVQAVISFSACISDQERCVSVANSVPGVHALARSPADAHLLWLGAEPQWNTAELAADFAALPVLKSNSPIRTWQLGELYSEISEDGCSSASMSPRSSH